MYIVLVLYMHMYSPGRYREGAQDPLAHNGQDVEEPVSKEMRWEMGWGWARGAGTGRVGIGGRGEDGEALFQQ